MSNYKVEQEIRKLLKMGFPEDYARVVGHANLGDVKGALSEIELMSDEQKAISEEIVNLVPFHEIYNQSNIIEDDIKDKKPDIQYKLESESKQ
jgi:hypothetical protein